MHTKKSIRGVSTIFKGQRIDLPSEPGVYAFWWTGDKSKLMGANKHIILKGPKEKPVDVEYRD